MLKRVNDKPDRPDGAVVRLPFLDGGPAAATLKVPGQGAQKKRRSLIGMSFALLVLLPTLLTSIYYAFIAANQYAAEARFAIRGASAAPSTDILGMFGGGAPTVTDSYIVMDFVRSRQVLDKIEPHVNYKAIFSHKNADYIARLEPTWAMEDVVRYWRQMVGVGFDTTSQILSIRVRAFTPEDALALSRAILKESEELINELSARSRADAVAAAELEVARMEERLKRARGAVEAFRESRQELDPRKKAEARQQIIETLNGELTTQRARLSTLRQQLSETAPTVIYQMGVIRALEKQIEEERKRIGESDRGAVGTSSGTIGSLISDYEALAVDREFAEKAYISALSSLERARFDATRQQRYVATIVTPALPDDAQYPKRIMNTLIVAGLATCLWALATLIGLAIRDHIT